MNYGAYPASEDPVTIEEFRSAPKGTLFWFNMYNIFRVTDEPNHATNRAGNWLTLDIEGTGRFIKETPSDYTWSPCERWRRVSKYNKGDRDVT